MRIPIAALSAVILVIAAGALQAQGRPAGVGVATVETQMTSETVAVFGEIVTGRESEVAAQVAGVAANVPVRVGDRLSQGQLVAQLDTELLELEVAAASAEIEIAKAQIIVADARLDRAEKALRRAETLRQNSTIAEAQLEDRAGDFNEALGSRQEARARLTAAETALGRAQYQLDNASIFAPFDAVVLDVSTEVGQFIAAGTAVATLLDIDAMEVEANVPARFITALKPNLPVEARTDVGDALGLALRAILPTEFAATRTRPVRFSISSFGDTVAVGQAVTLSVPVSAPREVLVVPKDALVQARGAWSVFLNAEGVAQPRTVEIGTALDGGFEVLSGLAEGDVVVVRGNERLRPGQPIAPMGGAPQGAGDAGGEEASGETADAESQG